MSRVFAVLSVLSLGTAAVCSMGALITMAEQPMSGRALVRFRRLRIVGLVAGCVGLVALVGRLVA